MLELKIPKEEDAKALYSELGRIHRTRILPLLDRCCTELSSPNVIHRIETLVLDLGSLNLRSLEEDLLGKLSEALYKALSEEIAVENRESAGTEKSSKDRSHLELLASFALSGALPWWADLTRPQLLDHVLESLIKDAPASLAGLMRELALKKYPLKRLALHFEPEILSRLARSLAPHLECTLPGLIMELSALIRKSKAATGKTASEIESTVWQAFLYAASLKGADAEAPAAFWKEVFLQIALELDVSYAFLLHSALLGIGPSVISTEWRNPKDPSRSFGMTDGSFGTAKDRFEAVGRLTEIHGAMQEQRTEPSFELRQKAKPLLAELLPGESRSDELIDFLVRLLQTNEPSSPLLESRLAGSSAPELLKELEVQAAKLGGEGLEDFSAPHSERLEDLLSDSDELFIENCGLVLLWPFLTYFFGRLGFLNEEKHFRNEAAVQRAVGLLQFIAAEEASPAEYLLPLNKILCGMEPSKVFEFGLPVSNEEAQECDDLLKAAIGHAPILNNMSISGFRGSFLLRKGKLGTRDGAWLLQVERESYDIVLDRFPWSIGWVKLPWMEAPLRVEW